MQGQSLRRRKLPKLYSLMTRSSLEQIRNRTLYDLDILSVEDVRRLKQPLHECIILELNENGYVLSSTFLQNIIYDNEEILKDDDLGIVVDLRKRNDYLELLCKDLKNCEKQHDKGNTKKETLVLLNLAKYFAEREKGIYWLAEKIFITSIAVGSQYVTDAGRQKACCKYNYGKFLLDKFPGIDDDESYKILMDVRNMAMGKDWMLLEGNEPGQNQTVFSASSILLHQVLLNKSRALRLTDTAKAETLARLAEKRAQDAKHSLKMAEAIVQIGICQFATSNLRNAQYSFERAFKIYEKAVDIDGMCESKTHLAAVFLRLGNPQTTERLLTEMGIMAMQNGQRKHLGRALHLLGELYLSMEKPEIGTKHLSEAFGCFIGYGDEVVIPELLLKKSGKPSKHDPTFTLVKKEVYLEEAEKSRFMCAISAGQELMASYFKKLREAGHCQVARAKVIQWNLNNTGWWIEKYEDELVPCSCPKHNRTALDVLKLIQLSSVKAGSSSDLDITAESERAIQNAT